MRATKNVPECIGSPVRFPESPNTLRPVCGVCVCVFVSARARVRVLLGLTAHAVTVDILPQRNLHLPPHHYVETVMMMLMLMMLMM